MNWIDTTVGEYCPFVYGKGLPKTKRKHGSHPVYGSNGCVGYHDEFYINGAGIIIGRKGSVGAVHLSEASFWPIDTSFYVVKDSLSELKFTYYLLKSLGLELMNSDSAVPGLNRDNAHALNIRIPEKQTDREYLGDKLALIDKKITNNSQTNQTLEEMAQAIFKSWFVDFDPVQAKIRGENPEGMDAVTAALFPDKLVESELGLIPEGWEISNIEDVVQRLKPKKRYTKKQVVPYGKTPVFEQGASILLGFHDDDAGFDASPEEPIFIFGDHTCITHLSCSKFDISSNVIPLKGSVRQTSWTYYAIQGKQEFQEYRRHWSEFIVKKVILPPDDLTKKYANLVTKMYLMVESLKRQSKELELLRDTLIPKLLSGEIELNNEET